MKIVKNKMRIIGVQESSLILENKPKAFATKDKSFFILPLLLKCEGSRATSVMARGLPWIIAHLGVF
jgi:hypothetical protein